MLGGHRGCRSPGTGQGQGRAEVHQRELTALSSCPTPAASRLVLAVRVCPRSLCQPGARRGYLMSLPSGTTAEQAGHTREARLATGLRPPALPLLPQRLQSQPAHQPTPPHDALGGRGGTPQGTPPRRRAFLQGQAIRSAQTGAAPLVRCVLRSWWSRRRCFIVLHTSAPCHLARDTYSTSAVDQGPASRGVRSNTPHAHQAKALVTIRSYRVTVDRRWEESCICGMVCALRAPVLESSRWESCALAKRVDIAR